jgi:hypothetical protein
MELLKLTTFKLNGLEGLDNCHERKTQFFGTNSTLLASTT